MTFKTSLGSYDSNDVWGGDIGRINIIFPEGGNQFNMFYNPSPDCYSDTCQILQNEFEGIGA